MADVIDHACGLEAKFTEMALANQLAGAKRIEQRESAHECGECGDPILQKNAAKKYQVASTAPSVKANWSE